MNIGLLADWLLSNCLWLTADCQLFDWGFLSDLAFGRFTWRRQRAGIHYKIMILVSKIIKMNQIQFNMIFWNKNFMVHRRCSIVFTCAVSSKKQKTKDEHHLFYQNESSTFKFKMLSIFNDLHVKIQIEMTEKANGRYNIMCKI